MRDDGVRIVGIPLVAPLPRQRDRELPLHHSDHLRPVIVAQSHCAHRDGRFPPDGCISRCQCGAMDEATAFLDALDRTPPDAPTACADWTAHELVAHLAAGAAEMADLTEA